MTRCGASAPRRSPRGRRRRSSRPAAARCRRSCGRTSRARGRPPPRRRRPAHGPCRRPPRPGWRAPRRRRRRSRRRPGRSRRSAGPAGPRRAAALSTGIAAMVVQLGLAMMPWPAAITAAASCGLTSETTSGMSGSLRKALELSTTITPASANFCASARDVVAPAENSAMSRPLGSAVAASSTTTSLPGVRQHGAGRPRRGEEADLADREVALLEDLAHRDADLAGGADDADVEGAIAHRPVPP